MEISAKPLVKLDLAPGDKTNAGYLRVGYSPDFDFVCDVRELKPIPDSFADEAMAIHVVEHLLPWELLGALVEWKRVLKPGGLLVLECPDLYKCCRNFVRDWGENPRSSILGIYGDPGYCDELMLHRYGYTPETLAAVVRKAGFIKVREKAPKFHARRLDRDLRLEARKP